MTINDELAKAIRDLRTRVSDLERKEAVPPGEGISGSGAINTIPKFTAARVIGDSVLSDDGLAVYCPLTIQMTGAAKYVQFLGTAGGGGEGIQYKDAGGSSRFALHFPGSDIVALSNRAANGVTQMRANNAAGAGGETVVVQAEYDTIRHNTRRVSQTNVIKQVFQKDIANDAAAHEVFTITTVNEAGSTDHGEYACIVKAVIATPQSAGAGASPAAATWMGTFARAIGQAGSGSNTAVTEVYEAIINTGAAVNQITAITMTVVETSEYIMSVQFLITVIGSTAAPAEIRCEVELIWTNFLTSPVMA